MKIKIDENLPESLCPALASLGHDVQTVPDEGLAGRDDGTVWGAAQSENRLLITQDLDFSDIRRFKPGTHAGLMLVRLRSPSRASLESRVLQVFSHEDVGAWPRCFVVISDRKVRVRRP